MKKIWYSPNKFDSYDENEINAVTQCLKDGWLAGNGEKSGLFEEKISKLFGKKYGVFVNSGSSAILLALESLELDKSKINEIITPASTFITTVAPIIQCGFDPIFCDVELPRYISELNNFKHLITKNTKVILLPNLVGNKPNWLEIKNYLKVINRQDIVLFEDSADTITYTNESDISITSFYASHIITAGGIGGMVMFNDKLLSEKCRMYRDWGRTNKSENIEARLIEKIDDIYYDEKYLFRVLPYNMKCSEMNAAFGLEQLKKLDNIIEKRSNNCKLMKELLFSNKKITLPVDNDVCWLAYPILAERRNDLFKFLEINNIQTRMLFSGNITKHPPFKKWKEDFKNSDIIFEKGLLLGIHQGLDHNDIKRICNLVNFFYKESYIDNRGQNLNIPLSIIPKEQFVVNNKKNVLRGIHISKYGKLVTCISGSIIDYVIDVKSNPPTYKKYILNPQTDLYQLYIPPNYGHLYISLEDETRILYQLEGYYDSNLDKNINYLDKSINLDISDKNLIISKKDLKNDFL
jgi:CDP-4-dehydro-6-deoxyglucose reductase, E1